MLKLSDCQKRLIHAIRFGHIDKASIARESGYSYQHIVNECPILLKRDILRLEGKKLQLADLGYFVGIDCPDDSKGKYVAYIANIWFEVIDTIESTELTTVLDYIYELSAKQKKQILGIGMSVEEKKPVLSNFVPPQYFELWYSCIRTVDPTIAEIKSEIYSLEKANKKMKNVCYLNVDTMRCAYVFDGNLYPRSGSIKNKLLYDFGTDETLLEQLKLFAISSNALSLDQIIFKGIEVNKIFQYCGGDCRAVIRKNVFDKNARAMGAMITSFFEM